MSVDRARPGGATKRENLPQGLYFRCLFVYWRIEGEDLVSGSVEIGRGPSLDGELDAVGVDGNRVVLGSPRSKGIAAGAARDIPLLDVVGGGEPFEPFEIKGRLSLSKGLWDRERIFALRIRGQSMVEEGIHDGDYLIVEPREVVENGRTVVAEVDGCVTVKKLYRDCNGQVRLQPANPLLLPLVLRPEKVRVLGAVIGILRKCDAPRTAPRRAGAVAAVKRGESATARSDPGAEQRRWSDVFAALRRAAAEKAAQVHEIGRDVAVLHGWYSRTAKPALRRALLAEAEEMVRRVRGSGGSLGAPAR